MKPFATAWEVVVAILTVLAVIHTNSFAAVLLLGLAPRVWKS